MACPLLWAAITNGDKSSIRVMQNGDMVVTDHQSGLSNTVIADANDTK